VGAELHFVARAVEMGSGYCWRSLNGRTMRFGYENWDVMCCVEWLVRKLKLGEDVVIVEGVGAQVRWSKMRGCSEPREEF